MFCDFFCTTPFFLHMYDKIQRCDNTYTEERSYVIIPIIFLFGMKWRKEGGRVERGGATATRTVINGRLKNMLSFSSDIFYSCTNTNINTNIYESLPINIRYFIVTYAEDRNEYL